MSPPRGPPRRQLRGESINDLLKKISELSLSSEASKEPMKREIKKSELCFSKLVFKPIFASVMNLRARVKSVRSSLPPSSRSAYIPTSVKAVLSRALKVSLVSKIVVLPSISDSDVLIRIIFAGGHQER